MLQRPASKPTRPPRYCSISYQVSNFEQFGSFTWPILSPAHIAVELPMFSYAIDIKRFQNLLETSVDDTERQTIEKLLTEEKAKAASQASEPKKD